MPITLLCVCLSWACGEAAANSRLLDAASMPIHLEDHLDAVQVTGSVLPADRPSRVEWRFADSTAGWKPAASWNPTIGSAVVTHTGEALRVSLPEQTRNQNNVNVGGVYVDVPNWNRADWGEVVVRARGDTSVAYMSVVFNLRAGRGTAQEGPFAFQGGGDGAPLLRDGTTQTYRIALGSPDGTPTDTIRQIGFWLGTDGQPGSIDILSVAVEPRSAAYDDPAWGFRQIRLAGQYRRAIYLHSPGRIAYRVRVPEAARLDAGLGVLRNEAPVRFRVRVEHGRDTVLLDEQYAGADRWADRSVDLSAFAGQTVTLALETEAEKPGAVAFWSAPTLGSTRPAMRPNVIFYVIDGAGADFMSVYGYNRNTTPALARLAAKGTVFEHAYSNATWTKPSTASFMTSLQHSVLGPYRSESDQLPDGVVTMAEHFHRAGYQTFVLTSNANAGSVSGLQRGVDVFTDEYIDPHSTSSVPLQQAFFEWRANHGARPYWVHFQTTDVHEPHWPPAPFAGRFTSPNGASQLQQWNQRLWRQQVGGTSMVDEQLKALTAGGVDRLAYFDVMRGLYDETMAHQDYQLGRFVERLEAAGEWENTILVIAADHGHPAASYSRFGRLSMDPVPPEWEGALLSSYNTHIPMIFVGPGVPAGKRIRTPVSMIDMLPTLLELAALPPPEVLQGQSLVPLMQDRPGFTHRPVIFDEFYLEPRTGSLRGNIEMIDGRWGASLEIAHLGATGELASTRRFQAPAGGRWFYPPHAFDSIPRLLLYDLWEDPLAFRNVNARYPELVQKYTTLLEKQWQAHRLLALRFTGAGQVELTPEQLETLRALGYIR